MIRVGEPIVYIEENGERHAATITRVYEDGQHVDIVYDSLLQDQKVQPDGTVHGVPGGPGN